MTPCVSVIIPTFNYARFLEEAIQSVLDQTFTDYEIIVVDGGSTDNTRDVVAQFGERVRYMLKPSPSPNNSRNEGILAAHGRYVAFLDADDKWLPDKLTLQVPLIESNREVGLVYGTMVMFDSETGAVISHFSSSRCRRGRVLRDLYLDQFISSPTPLIRREVFDRVGLFEEERATSDDWDLWLRIAAEYELDFVPHPLAQYRIHSSVLSTALSDYEMREKEMLAFFEQAAQRFPELQPLKKIRYSTYEEWFGWRLVIRGVVEPGRKRLRNAIKACPRRANPYLLLGISYLMGKVTFEKFQAAELAYAHGKYHLFNLHLSQARDCFLRAIRANPFSRISPYVGVVLTLSGRRLVSWVAKYWGAEYYKNSPAPGNNLSFTQW